jgi:23S rRNA (uracil1939-C5)-methyltransferase
VGFRERAAPYVADLQRCEVLSVPVGELIVPLSDLLTRLSIRDRIPQIEVAVADRAVALVMRVLDPLTDADTSLIRAFAAQHGVQMYLQPGGYDTIAALDDQAVELTYSLPQFKVELAFQPTDFVQINRELNEQMVSRAVALLQLTPQDQVLDLFCGLGNFSLPLARHAAGVVGVEGEAGLVARARQNAARNGITNAEFFTANLMDENLSRDPWALRRYDKMLLDPPRAGAREILPLMANSGARKIVYISCHPGSLARDAGILVQEYGFELCAAGVMDMFPHTTHVESIAVFERTG